MISAEWRVVGVFVASLVNVLWWDPGIMSVCSPTHPATATAGIYAPPPQARDHPTHNTPPDSCAFNF